jgi:hypothetical protein
MAPYKHLGRWKDKLCILQVLIVICCVCVAIICVHHYYAELLLYYIDLSSSTMAVYFV